MRGRPKGVRNSGPRQARLPVARMHDGRHFKAAKMYADYLKEDQKEIRYALYGLHNDVV